MSLTSRVGSVSSFESIGIGASKPQKQDTDLPRLRPEDGIPEHVRVYDCIVYLIICSKHNKIAVTNVKKNKVVWLPFVLLQEGITWEQAAHDGVFMLIGKKDAESDAKLPKVQLIPLNFLRIQMSGERYYIRYTHFVNLEKTSDSVCCENTDQSDKSSISWMALSDILQNENLWGPEVVKFIEILVNSEMNDEDLGLQIHEQTFADILTILNDANHGPFLTDCKINSDIVLAMYEEFIEHCYPSIFMCMASFKTFLIRYGYSRDNSRLQEWIFNALDYDRKGYIDFHDLLIGIVCMEPNTENETNRLKMLFRYYAMENNKDITSKEFIALIHDLNPNMDPKRLRNLVDELDKKIRDRDGRLPYVSFENAIKNKLLKGTEKLFRSPKAIIPQIYQINKSKNEFRLKVDQKSQKTQEIKIKDRGICNGCRAQKYQFGLHCVCFDTNGRCVKPLRLFDVRIEETMTPFRYSAEHVFGTNTICRNFLDIVRAAYQKNEALMTAPEDLANALKTIRSLCDFVHQILICEEKFMKVNAPALIIGNICGKIDSIMSLEKTFWKNVPILTTNLIFLGNYISGGISSMTKNNVEVICYLFALKIASPNMVFLLRGYNETIDTSKDLLNECIQKYGLDSGKTIWQEFNKVFNRMPFAILVDEKIFCVHSGIPKTAFHLSNFANIPEVVTTITKESPLALEIISNIPKDSDQSTSEISEIQTMEGKTMRKPEFNFHIFYNFMHSNNLSFMIRGHDMPSDGFKLHFDSRCITITSALSKNSTVALVDGGNEEIQLIKVMTSPQTKFKITSV